MVTLFLRAINGGARRLSMSAVEWDISGNCTAGFHTHIEGRPRDAGSGPFHEGRWHTFTGKSMSMRVTLITRCRKCGNCRKARANEWRFRAREELRRAARSWFGTLTLSPVEQYRILCEARQHAHSQSVDWRTLDAEERFKRVANTGLKEVTKYIKRVRKQSGVPLRYICVTERHKSGLPHYHLLVHEVELKPVTHKILSTQWRRGFEKWKLVPHEDLGGAGYIAKYLTKSVTGVRLHCSQRYGKSIGTVGPVLTMIKDHL